MRLSIVMPVFDEVATLDAVVTRVLSVDLPGIDDRELLLVDDGSRDGTQERAAELAAKHAPLKVLSHRRNRGKGAALRTGFGHATGDVVLIQDADLEYDPADYPRLLAPILEGRAEVVYGSRFSSDEKRHEAYLGHTLANRFVTSASNLFTRQRLTDMETCYKVFRREVIRDITLVEDRFGFEPEITAKLARRGVRIHEVPISYAARRYHEGKKIGWRDGVRALYCVAKYSTLG